MSKKVLDYFLELVRIDSESLHEGAVAEYLEQELEEMGAEISRDKAHIKTGGDCGNLLGKIAGEPDIEPLLLCAHMDTVEPGRNVTPVMAKDRILSSGNTVLGADDKSGIAMILAAVRSIKARGVRHAPLELLFTVSEEIGLLGAKFLDYSLLSSRKGYALDGNRLGDIVSSAPSQSEWQAEIRGMSAHAGIEPEKGINAIRCTALALSKIPDGRIDAETTMNVGKIHGGKANNIVCDKVEISGEIRSHNDDKLQVLCLEVEKILEETAAEMGCELSFKLSNSFRSVKLSSDSKLSRISEAAFHSLGRQQRAILSGGGSDANIFAEHGMEVAVVGTGMQNIHSVREFILLEDLETGKDWLIKVIELWSKS
jgi:tripeptide aminopeptidase